MHKEKVGCIGNYSQEPEYNENRKLLQIVCIRVVFSTKEGPVKIIHTGENHGRGNIKRYDFYSISKISYCKFFVILHLIIVIIYKTSNNKSYPIPYMHIVPQKTLSPNHTATIKINHPGHNIRMY